MSGTPAGYDATDPPWRNRPREVARGLCRLWHRSPAGETAEDRLWRCRCPARDELKWAFVPPR